MTASPNFVAAASPDRHSSARAERLLAVLANVTERLVGTEVDDATVADILAEVGAAAGVSRVRVFRTVREDRGRTVVPCQEWRAPGAELVDAAPSAVGNAADGERHGYADISSCPELVVGLVRELPVGEQTLLARPDVLALAAMPITTQRGLWGYIAFDDCADERHWSCELLSALRMLARMLGSAFDRCEYRRRTETLQASYHALLDNLNEGVFQTDDRGRFTYLNGAWRTLTGQPPSSGLGVFCGEMASAEDRRLGRRALLALLRGDVNSHRCELRLRHEDGSSRWVQVSVRRLENRAHGRCGLVGTIVDISAIKQVEEQLIAAKQEAEETSRAKSEFLSTMSHELRTPLNAVIGLSESLLEIGPEADVARTRRYLELINDSGRRLFTRINDILDLARAEAGRLKLNVAPVDVGMLCVGALETVRSETVEKRLCTELHRPEGPFIINADERLLSLALHKLLTNAIKFSTAEGRLTITATPRPDGGAVIAVADTGIGIPPEKLHLLFKPFSQLDASLSRRFSGTGLGLALVDKFVRLHGGSVSVVSRPVFGSTFTIELPPLPIDPPGPTSAATENSSVFADLS